MQTIGEWVVILLFFMPLGIVFSLSAWAQSYPVDLVVAVLLLALLVWLSLVLKGRYLRVVIRSLAVAVVISPCAPSWGPGHKVEWSLPFSPLHVISEASRVPNSRGILYSLGMISVVTVLFSACWLLIGVVWRARAAWRMRQQRRTRRQPGADASDGSATSR
jgi:hypothetical protein